MSPQETETGIYEQSSTRMMSRSTAGNDESQNLEKGGQAVRISQFFGMRGKEWILIGALGLVAFLLGLDIDVRSEKTRGVTLMRNHIDKLSDQLEVDTIIAGRYGVDPQTNLARLIVLTECKPEGGEHGSRR